MPLSRVARSYYLDLPPLRLEPIRGRPVTLEHELLLLIGNLLPGRAAQGKPQTPSRYAENRPMEPDLRNSWRRDRVVMAGSKVAMAGGAVPEAALCLLKGGVIWRKPYSGFWFSERFSMS